MKKGASRRLTPSQQAQLDKLAAMKDEDIDTRDIPEVTDWRGAKRGLFYRPIKRQLTLRIDADVVDWFRRHSPNGQGYQTKMNLALREYVQQRKVKSA
ncbi:MAG: BrnA antitoxin family protein [Alphaproteobacteria bacterium]|nr:BrnA antitoxin family protein [Alphaproteobacteria bacterium]